VTTFRLSEPGSPEITVENDVLRGPRVLADGQPIPRQRQRGRPVWPIPMSDGSVRQLFLVGQFIGLRALVAGREYPVERRLQPWELLLAVLPIGLVTLLVGAAGILTGGIATGLTFPLFRQPWPVAARIGAWAVLLVVAFAIGALLSSAGS
jgi:hypothetical protein